MEIQNEELKDHITGLTYLLREAVTAATRPGLTILLHGVGSNEADLFRLSGKFPPEFIVVSARAPYTMAAGRYAWFQVDLSSGRPVIDPEQAEQSRVLVNAFVGQLIEKYAVDPEKVYLGGFSQGGNMSYSTGLTFPEKFRGIFILSSRLLPEVKPLIKATSALQKLKIFIAHGRQDNVLPLPYAHEAHGYLKTLAPAISYHEYEMGHTTGEQELSDLMKWLAQDNS